MQKKVSETGEMMAYVVVVCGIAAMLFGLSGCGLMGVREADLWGAKFVFAEGLDVHVGANQIDHVDDTRGVNTAKGKRQR